MNWPPIGALSGALSIGVKALSTGIAEFPPKLAGNRIRNAEVNIRPEAFPS
jgi:hypothetical protein